jgi:hypothetical protein
VEVGGWGVHDPPRLVAHHESVFDYLVQAIPVFQSWRNVITTRKEARQSSTNSLHGKETMSNPSIIDMLNHTLSVSYKTRAVERYLCRTTCL